MGRPSLKLQRRPLVLEDCYEEVNELVGKDENGDTDKQTTDDTKDFPCQLPFYGLYFGEDDDEEGISSTGSQIFDCDSRVVQELPRRIVPTFSSPGRSFNHSQAPSPDPQLSSPSPSLESFIFSSSTSSLSPSFPLLALESNDHPGCTSGRLPSNPLRHYWHLRSPAYRRAVTNIDTDIDVYANRDGDGNNASSDEGDASFNVPSSLGISYTTPTTPSVPTAPISPDAVVPKLGGVEATGTGDEENEVGGSSTLPAPTSVHISNSPSPTVSGNVFASRSQDGHLYDCGEGGGSGSSSEALAPAFATVTSTSISPSTSANIHTHVAADSTVQTDVSSNATINNAIISNTIPTPTISTANAITTADSATESSKLNGDDGDAVDDKEGHVVDGEDGQVEAGEDVQWLGQEYESNDKYSSSRLREFGATSSTFTRMSTSTSTFAAESASIPQPGSIGTTRTHHDDSLTLKDDS
ncbi:hypothetical protein D9758_013476 [Tetrapyrgos nigripes]|uniref:Uncharacterized protein n=1 Tax=Tetrapyrgos nigripes TaxID=182062 RepID=A0A8H5FRL1_9AGAR|nr:hypothetical protein D9758_013476 [Tetrapyrgos nigripes]